MYNTAAIVTTQLNHGGKFSGKEFSNSSTTNSGPGEESGKRFKRFRSRHHRVPSADQPSTLKGFLVSSKVSILEVESLPPFGAGFFGHIRNSRRRVRKKI